MNPFRDPDSVNYEINKEIRKIITNIFREKGKIDFFEMLSYYETMVKDKKKEESEICGYYCVNVVNSNKNMTESEKMNLIYGIYREFVDNFENEEQNNEEQNNEEQNNEEQNNEEQN
jgi:hypothetical protein